MLIKGAVSDFNQIFNIYSILISNPTSAYSMYDMYFDFIKLTFPLKVKYAYYLVQLEQLVGETDKNYKYLDDKSSGMNTKYEIIRENFAEYCSNTIPDFFKNYGFSIIPKFQEEQWIIATGIDNDSKIKEVIDTSLKDGLSNTKSELAKLKLDNLWPYIEKSVNTIEISSMGQKLLSERKKRDWSIQNKLDTLMSEFNKHKKEAYIHHKAVSIKEYADYYLTRLNKITSENIFEKNIVADYKNRKFICIEHKSDPDENKPNQFECNVNILNKKGFNGETYNTRKECERINKK